MWRRCNRRRKYEMFPRICMAGVLVWMTILSAVCGRAYNALPEEEQNVLAVEPDQQEPSIEIEEPDATYDFGPVSYDLTNLPPMENQQYAAWEGCIYFRQYSDEDLEEMYWGYYFPSKADAKKELMRMNTDGSVEQVGVDYGDGGLYIIGGRIYSSRYSWTDDDGREVIRGGVYSCALDGSDVREYVSQEVLAVRGDRIICGIGYDDGISWIDARDGQEHVLVEAFDSYHESYLAATEEEMFFSKLVWNEEEEEDYPYTAYDLILYSMDYQGNTKDLARFTVREYETYIDCTPEVFDGMHLDTSPLFIPYVQILGEELYFSVGTTNGTGRVWTGGLIYGMKKDGSDCQMLVSDSYNEYFYLYDEGGNRALYFESGQEGEGVAIGNKRMRRIVLSGEPRKDVIPWGAEESYESYDTPQVRLTRERADSILFYPDTSGICYALLTAEECEKFGIETTYENSSKKRQRIGQIEYLEGRLFFTVTDLIYREDWNNSRWGYGYERGTSVCYCKDLTSGEIRALYEY